MLRNYSAISFTGSPSEGPFDQQILAGRKTQTIRRPRKDSRVHVKVGYTTRLWWKMRNKKENRLIGVAEVTAYEEIRLLDMWFDEENAKADGFRDLEEFREWFWDSRETGQPGWSRLPSLIKDAVKAAASFSQDTLENVIFGISHPGKLYSKSFGKSITMKIVEYLIQPVYRIKWKYPLCQQTAVNA